MCVFFVMNCITENVYAEENTIVINEYEEIKNSLVEKNISRSDSSKIINEYKEHIYELKNKFSDIQLKDLGYTRDQINSIRNYDGTEEMTIKASTLIKATPAKDKMIYNSKENLTTAKLSVTFQVNGVLGYYFTNYAALSMVASNGNPFQPVFTSTSSGQVTYKVINDSGSVINHSYKNASKDGDDNVDGAYKFSFKTRPTTNELIESAKFSIESSVEGKPASITFRFAYGYATLNLGIGVGITIKGDSVSGSIAFEPKIAVTLLPSDDLRKQVIKW